jgi:hypothetical protein
MKKTLRCLGLASALGLTLWASAPRPALAVPTCESLQGQACRPYNSTTPCVWASSGAQSTCWCYFLRGWICLASLDET